MTPPEQDSGHGGPEHEDDTSDPGAGMGGTGADSIMGDPRVQAGLEHLQRAAHEVIAASRALLDVAEELVEDPKAAGSLVDMLGSLASMARPGGRAHHDAGRHDDGPDEDEPPVQRIPVS
jgi:hypothetical protein